MRVAHLGRVFKLWQETEGVGVERIGHPPNLAAYLKRNAQMSFVAREGDQIIGAVLCGHDGRRGYLHHLAVAKDHRRRGIGTQLVEACLKRLKTLRLLKCNIFVYEGNGSGAAFWKQDDWAHRPDLRLMQKALL
jgi:ribosomal protein S18 acetylase RimI-like enzyme